MTRLDVLRHLRGIGEPIPVIVITSALDAEIRAQELEGGALACRPAKPMLDSVLLGIRRPRWVVTFRLPRGVGR